MNERHLVDHVEVAGHRVADSGYPVGERLTALLRRDLEDLLTLRSVMGETGLLVLLPLLHQHLCHRPEGGGDGDLVGLEAVPQGEVVAAIEKRSDLRGGEEVVCHGV